MNPTEPTLAAVIASLLDACACIRACANTLDELNEHRLAECARADANACLEVLERKEASE